MSDATQDTHATMSSPDNIVVDESSVAGTTAVPDVIPSTPPTDSATGADDAPPIDAIIQPEVDALVYHDMPRQQDEVAPSPAPEAELQQPHEQQQEDAELAVGAVLPEAVQPSESPTHGDEPPLDEPVQPVTQQDELPSQPADEVTIEQKEQPQQEEESALAVSEQSIIQPDESSVIEEVVTTPVQHQQAEKSSDVAATPDQPIEQQEAPPADNNLEQAEPQADSEPLPQSDFQPTTDDMTAQPSDEAPIIVDAPPTLEANEFTAAAVATSPIDEQEHKVEDFAPNVEEESKVEEEPKVEVVDAPKEEEEHKMEEEVQSHHQQKEEEQKEKPEEEHKEQSPFFDIQYARMPIRSRPTTAALHSSIEFVDSVSLPSATQHSDSLANIAKEVDALKQEVMEETKEKIAKKEEWKEEFDDAALIVDEIQIDEIHQAEQQHETERIAALQASSSSFLHRFSQLKRRDQEARERNTRLHTAMLENLQKRKLMLTKNGHAYKSEQSTLFSQTQSYLQQSLDMKKRQLEKEYGTLQTSSTSTDCLGKPREAQQRHADRLICLKVDCLRAVKNKLPGGFYVVLCTLYDRLGGHPLRSCILSDKKSGITHSSFTQQPQRHGGKYYNLELSFCQEENLLSMCCPSYRASRPNNVIYFEVIRVRNEKCLNDRVVAWGVFPLMNANKSLISGKYKLPLIRGEIQMKLDKYSLIEEYLKKDIDHWLCNLYFEAYPIPVRAKYKYLGMIGLKGIEYKLDKAQIMKGGKFGAGAGAKGKNASGGKTGSTYSYGMSGGGSGGAGGDDKSSSSNTKESSFASGRRGAIGGASSIPSSGPSSGNNLSSDLLLTGVHDMQRKLASRERAKELRTYKYSITNPESDVPVNPGREKIRFLTAEITSDIGLSRIATLEFWSIVLFFVLTWWLRIWIHYFGQYLFLKMSWFGSSEADTAISEFTVEWITCRLYYTIDEAKHNVIVTQALVLIMGVVSNQICWLGMCALSYVIQKAYGSFSDAAYRFLLMYIINIILDPISIVLVDISNNNMINGDYFKLYHAYADMNTASTGDSSEDGGIGYAGSLLSVTLGLLLMCISFLFLFLYLTKLHMSGRMLDIYSRLHSDEGDFFLPNDLEISVRTLRYILGKAKKWQGFHGTRRKVLLTAYQIDDHLDSSFHDRTLHLSIYNVTPAMRGGVDMTAAGGGVTGIVTKRRAEQREIHRHFIRTNDGTLLEAFDGVESYGADGYLKLEEKWLTQEAQNANEKEIEEEEMMQQMLQDQKRADAEKKELHSGKGTSSVKLRTSTSSPNKLQAGSDTAEPSVSGMGHQGGGMSVVQELSQERSEFDENEEPQQGQTHEMLEHIGEEASDEDN